MRFIPIFLICCLTYGCSGGDSTPSSDSITVEPSFEKDEDRNGIRDSVDTAISAYATDNTNRNSVNEIANKMQSVLDGDDESTVGVNTKFKDLLDTIECGEKNNQISLDDLMFLKIVTLDTEERQAAYSSAYLRNTQEEQVDLITEVEC